ncbi:MAG: hypothetical protein J7599_16115 [Niabella sp.]|nr:hypothetical protein [Niabella sp.]
MNNTDTFPGFNIPYAELEKYIEAAGIFTIMLKNGSIIHFKPEYIQKFHAWLAFHCITNLKSSI